MTDTGKALAREGQSQAITGWRAWRLRRQVVNRDFERHTHTLAYWLQSLYKEHWEPGEWEPNRAPHAKCRGSLKKVPPHQLKNVPAISCSCGYGAFESLDGLLRDLGGRPLRELVIGEVAMWGLVRVGRIRFRSAFAYPTSLYVVRNWWSWDLENASLVADSLAAYGVTAADIHSDELPT